MRAAVTSFFMVFAVAGLATACEDAKPAGRAHQEVISTATTCEELASDPIFQGTAKGVGELRSGQDTGCTVEVPAGSPSLDRLGLETGCPDEASILLPFDRSAKGWRLDGTELEEIDNADCIVGR